MSRDMNPAKLREYLVRDAILKANEGVAQRLRLFYCARHISRHIFSNTGDTVKTSGMDIRNHKKRGHWAELRFMAKAAELGFQLNTPLGDTAQYDVVIDLGGRFIRVQVKSTRFQASNLKPGNFVASLVHVCGPDHRYRQSDFDYLAVYCIPDDVWYIIPWAVACQTVHLRLPGRRTEPVGALPGSLASAARPCPCATAEARLRRHLRDY